MSDQVLARAIIEVGAKGIADTKTQLIGLEAKLNTLKASYAAGTVGIADYLKKSQQLQSQIDQLTGGLTAAEAAVKKYGSATAAAAAMSAQLGQQTKQAGTSGAMGLLVLSQTIDDMQYGFKAIVNNIPQMGMAVGSAFGMSAEAAMKFAGAAGIAAVAVNVLINHWDDLMDLMGMGKILTEAEQMEKLAKATKFTADEQERLNRFKREEKIGKEFEGKQSAGVEKTEAAVKDAYVEFGDEEQTGREKIVNDLVAARRGRGEGEKMNAEEKQQIGNIFNDFGGTAYGKFKEKELRDKIQDRLDTEDVKRAQHTVDTAAFDPARRKELIAELGADPSSPQYAVAMKLQEAGPEGQERERKAAADAAMNVANQDLMAERKKVADDLAKKQSEQLDAANAADYEKARDYRKHENERLAGAMRDSVGQTYLKRPDMSQEDLQAEVKKQMQRAGMAASEISQAMVGTAKKLKENLDKAVKDRSMERGISEGAARGQLAKEAQAKDDKDANKPKAEVMSTESYLNKLLVGALDKKDDTPQKQLTEAQAANKLLGTAVAQLKELNKPKKGTFATVAPGR